MRIDTPLFKGTKDSVNKDLLVSYVYTFEPEGQYQTVKETPRGNLVIHPSFGVSISEGFDKNRIYVPYVKYFHFVSLFDKSINLISDNLYEIFPDINKIEFEIDSRVLERFQTEKALASAGMTIIPDVWVDETSSCYPALRINVKGGHVTIPFEDSIAMREMFKRFDPLTYSINMLRFFGKWE